MSTQHIQHILLKRAYAMKAEECRDSFYQFVKYMWSEVIAEKYTYNWHIKKLCERLEYHGKRLLNGLEKEADICINISPGETKSIIVSQMFDAWLLANNPSIKFLGSSHNFQLSSFNSMKTQDIILSEKFKKTFGVIGLKDNMKGKGDFLTTKNGRRKTTSVKTKVTGSHFHVIAFDDVVDADGMISTADMRAAQNHMDKCWSRVVDIKIALFIMVMQRVAANDPTTYFISKCTGKVEHIVLPADDSFPINPPEWRKYYKDGVMNPKRKTEDELQKIKSKGLLKYNAQYGQSPNDAKGKNVKRDMFVYKSIDDFPKDFFIIKNKMVADTAYTEDDKNDPSGFLICSYKNNSLYLLDFWEHWLELIDAVDRMAFLMGLWGCDACHIENKASGKSIAQTVRRLKGLNAIDYNQKNADKKARLVHALPMIEAKRVVIVWGDEDQKIRMNYFLDCVCNFPDSTIHDEAVDTIVMAINLCTIQSQREFN